ncbi:hypothetical protein ACP93_02435 [Xanthomonas sp. NCPPB 1128]|uniref:hypothetical protein n=1 Tax=Xanthomonas sp. NCPPB 1128 TaxID=1775876 RepID=UPI00065AC6C8|nr:hypothetical protein [Xanthomonas sp. NCPPB 1128]KMM77042.1 hypothetical protein ACP93_02170 [Xanthomonas sp. NCPPB 1128]KMM77086.1 hypothetical protein ACP93_02435 [Xanthomonas sp. NCPPB 1128]
MTTTITPDAPDLPTIIASMHNFADVADSCEITHGNAPAAIRAWICMLQALPELQAAQPQAEQHDRARETSRRQAAVAHMLAEGWSWDGLQWCREPQAEQQGLPELFVQWLEREMPAGTVIGRPAWWAPKLVRALRNAERGVLGGCNG